MLPSERWNGLPSILTCAPNCVRRGACRLTSSTLRSGRSAELFLILFLWGKAWLLGYICSLLRRSIGEWACALAKNEVTTYRQRLSRQVLLLQLCNGEQTHCRMGYGRQSEASSCRKGGGFPKDVTSHSWMCQLAAVEAFLCPAETWTAHIIAAHIIAESEARKVGTSSDAFFTSLPPIPVPWDTSTSLQCGPIPLS